MSFNTSTFLMGSDIFAHLNFCFPQTKAPYPPVKRFIMFVAKVTSWSLILCQEILCQLVYATKYFATPLHLHQCH